MSNTTETTSKRKFLDYDGLSHYHTKITDWVNDKFTDTLVTKDSDGKWTGWIANTEKIPTAGAVLEYVGRLSDTVSNLINGIQGVANSANTTAC